jgi:hypothetical protein
MRWGTRLLSVITLAGPTMTVRRPVCTRQASACSRALTPAPQELRARYASAERQGRVSIEWSGSRRSTRQGSAARWHSAVLFACDGRSVGYDQMMRATETIVDLIDARLRQLHEEIRTLTLARGALEGRDAPAVKQRPPGTPGRVSRSDNRTGAGAAARSGGETAPAASSEISPRAPQQSQVRARSKRGRRRRSVGVVAAGQLEALLSANPEMTTSALAERADADREQVLTALRELEAAGRVRRSGERRSTRWHAITDEERIEARAAELAARSKSAA